jgi:hypothetical protein
MRFFHQIWLDAVSFSERLKGVADLMKVLGALVVVALVGWAALTLEWWRTPLGINAPRSMMLLGIVVLCVFFYLGHVAARCGSPFFTVGRLTADSRLDYPVFFVRVTNRGPGPIKPIAKVTYMRDGMGRELTLRNALLAQEVHWRDVPMDERPTLRQGDSALAGFLFVNHVKSECPRLCIYPIDLEVTPLWRTDTAYEEQSLRLQFTITYESEGEEIAPIKIKVRTFSYEIKPDKNEPLKFKASRVRFHSMFWR